MATEKDNGGPAFPCKGTKRVFTEAAMDEAGLPQGQGFAEADFTGMSLRDYFAAKALTGMHARDSYDEGQATPAQRAAIAYLDADAMLKERAK